MHTIGQLKSRILDVVSKAPDRRIRPIDLERTIIGEGESSKPAIKKVMIPKIALWKKDPTEKAKTAARMNSPI